VRTLKNAIIRNRIAHAYLFVVHAARARPPRPHLRQGAQLREGPTPTPCGECAACRDIAAGTHLDVIEIDGASNNGVDQVRDLRETVQYAPASGRYKVYIIDEVHMLSAAAFNALLKTLEEPPEHVKFIFATTEAQKVLPTIVSRCQRFDLRPISDELITERLKRIAEVEKIEVSPEALASISRLADGGMRDAQSIFDQMIAFCGQKISEADVLDVYGLVGAEQVAKLAAAIAAGDHRSLVENG
jgi:DNA polymerase-3 subunit gamma/tau